MTDSACLSCVSASLYVDQHVKLAVCLCCNEGLANDDLQCLQSEILVDISLIYCDLTCSRY